MVSFKLLPPKEIATELAHRLKDKRLAQKLTQEGLANRSGVALPTLRKFERTGEIALVSFLRLATALGDESALENLLLNKRSFGSLDDILNEDDKPMRGRLK